MELLEGQSLRDRLAHLQGPWLASDELMDMALQIIDGLEAAHQKGIVHRDIKPANVFVTTRGQAKILDFGLAKLERGVRPAAERETAAGKVQHDAATATVSSVDPRLTRTGTTMGTAAYMSPAQIRREELDGRSDLFSFGLVLYEMATGKQAFAGDTTAAVHEAIVRHEAIRARGVNPELPAQFDEIISRALKKDRNLRY